MISEIIYGLLCGAIGAVVTLLVVLQIGKQVPRR